MRLCIEHFVANVARFQLGADDVDLRRRAGFIAGAARIGGHVCEAGNLLIRRDSGSAPRPLTL